MTAKQAWRTLREADLYLLDRRRRVRDRQVVRDLGEAEAAAEHARQTFIDELKVYDV